jgi:hypothetical protein
VQHNLVDGEFFIAAAMLTDQVTHFSRKFLRSFFAGIASGKIVKGSTVSTSS